MVDWGLSLFLIFYMQSFHSSDNSSFLRISQNWLRGVVDRQFWEVEVDKLFLNLSVVNSGCILRVHLTSDCSKIVLHTPEKSLLMNKSFCSKIFGILVCLEFNVTQKPTLQFFNYASSSTLGCSVKTLFQQNNKAAPSRTPLEYT